MSAAAERRDPIDLEEFERRLRAPDLPEPSRDPLADLARLVAGQGKPSRDPLASIFAEQAPAVEHEAPMEQARFAQELPDLSQMMRRGFDEGGQGQGRFEEHRFEPTFDAPAAYDASTAHESQRPEDYRPSAEYEDWAEQDSVPPDAAQPAPPASRSRRPLYLTAAVIGVGLAAIGGTLAWRGGASSPQGVTIIKAASGPTKVQPDAKDGKDVPGQASTMLDKSVATPPVKKVVTREEPPMDVSAAEKSPRVIPLGGSSDPAKSAPVPPPPIQTTSPAQPTTSVFPEPKKVKTVAVRADGTIISSEAAKPAPAAPAQPAARNSTPKTDTRAAATPTPQTTPQAAKPVAPPKPPTTTAAAAPKPPAVAAVAKPTPAAVAKPKPQVAAVQPQDEETDDDAAPAKPAAATGGGFGLQLAAAGSEGEARATAQRLGEKFSGALGGRRPSVVKATDKASVWRIRVGGMSRESAVGACEKIRAAGGACIIVH